MSCLPTVSYHPMFTCYALNQTGTTTAGEYYGRVGVSSTHTYNQDDLPFNFSACKFFSSFHS